MDVVQRQEAEKAEAKLLEVLVTLDNEQGTRLHVLFENVLRQRFDDGFQLAASIEQRAAKEALQQYVLDVLGKDKADGLIDLGALGTAYHIERIV